MKPTDLIEASDVCRDVKITEETKSRVLSKEEGLKKILDIEIGIQLKPEQWTRILGGLFGFLLYFVFSKRCVLSFTFQSSWYYSSSLLDDFCCPKENYRGTSFLN